MPRIFTIHSPLGEELLLKSLVGDENLGSLFHFSLTLVSQRNSIQPKELLGKAVTIQIETEAKDFRFLNAQVVSFKKTHEEERYTEYRAELMPWLWYTTRTSDCKIFLHKTVVQIIDEVLADYPFPVKKKLSDTYKEIGYCVQYNETDFNFLSRLMEQEGIYYYFEHDDGQHTLVLADYISAHNPVPGHAMIRFVSADKVGTAGEECIRGWHVVESVKPGRFVTDDYDFKKPSANLQKTQNDPKKHDHANEEIYYWGQGYTDPGHGEHLTKVQLESLQLEQEYARGETTVRRMAPGCTFTLYQHPDAAQNIEYLITGTAYHFHENPYATGHHGESTEWSIEFKGQKSSVQYRPTRVTPWPHIGGPQTAVVTGPKGQEIWCDKYGRVKVQFPWDRYGKYDENSSCWIRASNPWAGSNYGSIHIPRIGQEVLVEYINGDPNRPIITGRVYNEEQMPPWELPANATQSGILTRSTPKGGYGNANAIRFEDKKGAEQVWIQAERNMDIEVEHNETVTVKNDKTVSVSGFHKETVVKDMTVDVTKGKQVTTVESDITITSKNGVITLEIGASSITMTKDNIVIKSPRVDINP